MSIAVAQAAAQASQVRAREAAVRQGRFADALASATARAEDLQAAGSSARKGRAPMGAASPSRTRRPSSTADEGVAARTNAPPSAGAGSAGRPEARVPEPPGALELRACVRAAPAVIAASLRPGGTELALSFGGALSLDVRSGAHGLELTLRPAAGLERVTRAELPGLLEALRARGLRVARAEVRPRAPALQRRAR